MKTWPISKQLKVAMGSLAVAIIALAALALGSGARIMDSALRFKVTAALSVSGSAIMKSMFEASGAEALHRLTKDPASIEEVRTNLDEIHREIASTLSAPGVRDDVRHAFRTLKGEIDDYQRLFEAEVAQSKAEVTLLAALTAAEQAVAEAVAPLADAAFEVGLAAHAFGARSAKEQTDTARLHLARFLSDHDTADRAATTDAIGNALHSLGVILSDANASAIHPAVAAARDALTRLGTAAEDLENGLQPAQGIHADLDQTSARILALQDRLVDTFAQDQAAAGASLRQVLQTSLIGMTVVTLLTVAGGLTMMRRTVRNVTGGFDDALETMSALADGNLDVEVRGTERQTEFGRMARALEVFQRKGRDARAVARQAADAQAERAARERALEDERREADAARERAEIAAAEARKREIFEALRDAVSSVVSAAAHGDFSRRVDTSGLEAELRGLADEINRLMGNVDRGLGAISQVSERLAAGDLREGMQGGFEGTFAALQQNIGDMIGALSGLFADVSEEAAGVRAQSREMTEASDDLARRAETQAASLEETSAAMTEIAASAESNASSAARTDTDAEDMRREADQARTVLDATVAAMADIQDNSKEIEAIVDVIEEIAFQTNLLSLNASVEAARAGEAGKGFAVVANEVRALAQRSAEASSKVQHIITQNTGAIARGSDAVGETGAALGRIVERVARVTESLREIRASSEDQAAAVKDVTNGIAQLDKITQRNATAAEETRGTASLLSTLSERMQEAVSRVRLSQNHGVTGRAGTPGATAGPQMPAPTEAPLMAEAS